VTGAAPATGIEVTDPDPAWRRQYDSLAGRIREALGWRVLQLDHVGSTSVPGLAAKPVIDIDLTVADPRREQDYVPALETIGFRLVVREPWWYGHRALRADEPRCNLHVFGFDSPEPVRLRIFRDWLRGNPGDRDRYAAAKRQAASEANAGGEHVMQYNARKEQVIREIYHRAFVAAGLLEELGREDAGHRAPVRAGDYVAPVPRPVLPAPEAIRWPRPLRERLDPGRRHPLMPRSGASLSYWAAPIGLTDAVVADPSQRHYLIARGAQSAGSALLDALTGIPAPFTAVDTAFARSEGPHLFVRGQHGGTEDRAVSPFEVAAIGVMPEPRLGSRQSAV
jgi:GrpB-like predicted nucleotidyltransferase (UPF0157 family)